MMQKIVIRLPTAMDDEKCRSRALKVAVEITGVESAAVEGEELVVIGVGIDWEKLIHQLKKKLGDAVLVGFEDAEDEQQPIPSFPAVEQRCKDCREPSCCNPCTIM